MPKSAFTDAYALMIESLISARERAGVTQAQLGERLNKPQPWVSKVERGVRRIDVVEFYAIARALKVDPVEMFADLVRRLPKKVEIA